MTVLERPAALHTAPEQAEVRADRSGTVHHVRPRVLGEAVVALGGGRTKVGQDIDPGVGFEVTARPGGQVAAGDVLARVHARDADGLELGRRAILESVRIADGPAPEQLPLVLERISAPEYEES